MKALIDPRNNRVCEVNSIGFVVGEPFFWVDCSEEVNSENYCWDPETNSIVVITDQILSPLQLFFKNFSNNVPKIHESIVKKFVNEVFPNIELTFLRNDHNEITAFSAHVTRGIEGADLVALNSIKRLVQMQHNYGVPSLTTLAHDTNPSAVRLAAIAAANVSYSSEIDIQRNAYQKFFIDLGHTVELIDSTYVAYVPYTFELAKNAKKKLIEIERDEKINSGINWNSHKWDTDESSRKNISSAVSFFNASGDVPDGFVWRDKENQNVSMTLLELNSFANAVAEKINLEYNISWQRKASVDDATTQEQIDAA